MYSYSIVGAYWGPFPGELSEMRIQEVDPLPCIPRDAVIARSITIFIKILAKSNQVGVLSQETKAVRVFTEAEHCRIDIMITIILIHIAIELGQEIA